MDSTSRRAFLKNSLALGAGAAVGVRIARAAGPRRPNVLLIMTDQHRKDAIGAYGNTVVKTPNIDSLAAAGVRFNNCWVQHSVCMPSRACIFTGRYPMAHGVRSNGVPLPETEITIANVLADAGYRTGGAGKFHFIPHYPYRSPLPMMEDHPQPYYGFQEFHLGEDGRSGEHWVWIRENYPEHDKTPDDKIPLELHNSHWSASHTIKFIEGCVKADKPFFAFCSFVDPHHGYNPPEPYASMYKQQDMPEPISKEGEFDETKPAPLRARSGKRQGGNKSVAHNRTQYYGEVTFIDDSIGRILRKLDELGVRDDTIVIFTSDHGDMLGDHGLYYKGIAYRQSASVALIISRPGAIRKAKVVEGIVQQIDIMPTILELLGIDAPPGIQGISQANVLTSDSTDTRNEYAYIEHPPQNYSLRSLQWRFTYWPNEDTGELYDIENDPDEFTNLWNDPAKADLKMHLMGRLTARIAATRDPLPVRKKPY